MAKEYGEQLKDQRWLYIRERILERDKWNCCNCGSKRNLQVHHRRYIKGRMAWEYNDEFLVTLCDKCHKKVHEEWGTIKKDHLQAALDDFVTVAAPYKVFMQEKFPEETHNG